MGIVPLKPSRIEFLVALVVLPLTTAKVVDRDSLRMLDDRIVICHRPRSLLGVGEDERILFPLRGVDSLGIEFITESPVIFFQQVNVTRIKTDQRLFDVVAVIVLVGQENLGESLPSIIRIIIYIFLCYLGYYSYICCDYPSFGRSGLNHSLLREGLVFVLSNW